MKTLPDGWSELPEDHRPDIGSNDEARDYLLAALLGWRQVRDAAGTVSWMTDDGEPRSTMPYWCSNSGAALALMAEYEIKVGYDAGEGVFAYAAGAPSGAYFDYEGPGNVDHETAQTRRAIVMALLVKLMDQNADQALPPFAESLKSIVTGARDGQ